MSSSSPKFKIIVNGVAEGYHPERVRAAVGNRFGITPAQVEQLLASQGGLLTELVDHQTAWQLKNLLQQLGVNCRIAPVPLAVMRDGPTTIRRRAAAALNVPAVARKARSYNGTSRCVRV